MGNRRVAHRHRACNSRKTFADCVVIRCPSRPRIATSPQHGPACTQRGLSTPSNSLLSWRLASVYTRCLLPGVRTCVVIRFAILHPLQMEVYTCEHSVLRTRNKGTHSFRSARQMSSRPPQTMRGLGYQFCTVCRECLMCRPMQKWAARNTP